MIQLVHGDRIVCSGDSITEHVVAVSDAAETQVDELPPVGHAVRIDRHERRGWVAMLTARATLAFPDLDLSFLNAGRGGDTSRQLLERFTGDVLSHRPQLCLIAVGVNDVRRNFQTGRAAEVVSADDYRTNLLAMWECLQGAGSRVVFIEPTPHAGRPTGAPQSVTVGDVNAMTRAYSDVMRWVAVECGATFVPLLELMLDLEERLQRRIPPRSLFEDEVHLSALGDLHYSEVVFGTVFRGAAD